MKRLSIILLTSLMLYGCSTTSIVSSWIPDNSTIISMKKVLVVGLMGNKERELREYTERAVAKALTDNGITAIAAIDAMGVPPKDMKENKDAIDKELKDKAYDGIMIISLINKDKDVDINSPGLYTGWWYGPYWGYGGGMYGYAPPYISVSTKYGVEANLYTVTPEKLLYSALTKSYEPSNTAKLSEKFALSILKDMQKQRLVMPANK
ncbi:MAG: hypothetical protein LBL90_02210 [Prevotellaceae bacterium]|nr:hypothetical protein [Prevotellaceae bacterium]